MIIGVDEAGRGCIIGPMVICAAAINPLDEYKMKEMGVKDSKKLSPLQREKLYPKVAHMCKYATAKISAQELNVLMDKYTLNEIEAMKIAQLIETLSIRGATVYVDSPDNVPAKFTRRIEKYLKAKEKIVSANKADDLYLIVGAASIIAKVTRDREIEKIKKETGIEFNSGYTSDPVTQKYIAQRKEYPALLPYLRTKWSTLRQDHQKKLFDFEGKE
jgi:ribonuclease HII